MRLLSLSWVVVAVVVVSMAAGCSAGARMPREARLRDAGVGLDAGAGLDAGRMGIDAPIVTPGDGGLREERGNRADEASDGRADEGCPASAPGRPVRPGY